MSHKKRGRPKLTGNQVRLVTTLTLREGKDDDLIEWFSDIPTGQRASEIERALRKSICEKSLLDLLNLRQGIDDDLLGWFEKIPADEHAQYVRTALRQGGVTFKEETVSTSVDSLLDDDAFAGLLDGI